MRNKDFRTEQAQRHTPKGKSDFARASAQALRDDARKREADREIERWK